MRSKPFQYSLSQLLLLVVIAAATFGFTRSCGEYFAGLVVGLVLILLVVRQSRIENPVAGGAVGFLLASGFVVALGYAIPQPWYIQMPALPIYAEIGCFIGVIRALINELYVASAETRARNEIEF